LREREGRVGRARIFPSLFHHSNPDLLSHPLFHSLLAVLAGPPLLAHNPVGAALGAILPAFLAIQATRVQFVFSPTDLEVKIASSEADTENAFVGGKNKWPYSTFTNWEIFPSPALPILVYFKETQTKAEGQIHFFPVIFDFKTLYAVMKARCGRSVNSA